MSSQNSAKLSCFVEMVQEGIPLTYNQIQPLVSQLQSERSQSLAITKLLSLLIEASNSTEKEGKKEWHLPIVEGVLDSLIPLLQVDVPLKYLINRQGSLFTIFCGQSQHKEIKDLALRSCGLYPLNNQQTENSIFSLSPKGNPHWMCSRYVLKQWFILNRDQLPQNILQTYSFLLSETGFTAGPNVLGKFWGVLYCYYTQQLLEREYVLSEKGQKYLTWRHSSQQSYRLQLQAFEDILPEPLKIIYHLVTLLMPFLLLPKRSLSDIYATFTSSDTHNNIELEMINQTLFLKMAAIMDCGTVKSKVNNKARRLILQQGRKLNAFLPLYFAFEEILPMIVDGYVVAGQLTLTQPQKKEVALRLLDGGQMNSYWLPYLPNEQFLQLLSTQQWSDYSFADRFLKLITNNRPFFLARLAQLAQQPEMPLVQSQLNLFLKAWNNYSLGLKNQSNSKHMETALQSKTEQLRKRFQFMVLPRTCPQAVFYLLMNYSHYFNGLRSQIAQGGTAKKQLIKFQEEQLPQLLVLITEQQRTEFWMEFGNVTRSDPELVDAILLAAQPPSAP